MNIQGPFSRIEYHDIDLNSTTQVKDYLLSVGWVPTEYNKSKIDGRITSPKLTEDSFDSIQGDLGKMIARRGILRHRRNTVLNYEDPENKGIIAQIRSDGRMEAGGITCGTPTGRTTHRGIVNIPKAKPKIVYGKEMRSIFCVRDPYVMLGADLKQIETVVAAHYASLFDGGFFIKTLEEYGSIHDYNATLIDRDRDTAKSFLYCLMYGGGYEKVSKILNCSLKKSKHYVNSFWNGNPGLRDLKEYLERYYKKYGFIKGIDGRKIYIRAEYKLINSLFQTVAGIIFKKWGCICNSALREDKVQCYQILAMHDEYDYRCHKDHTESAKLIIIDAALRAGEYFKIKMPILVDVKEGSNWAEVH